MSQRNSDNNYVYRGRPRSSNRGISRGTSGPGDQNSSRSTDNSPANMPAHRQNMPRAPNGICNFYWSTGACNRGFECTFRHQPNTNVVEASAIVSPSDDIDQAPDFFSTEGLAFNNGSVRNEQHTLKPSEAHNHLKQFTPNNFVFLRPLQVEGFARIFASVDARNKHWVRLVYSCTSILI